jgi:hypothetical protein
MLGKPKLKPLHVPWMVSPSVPFLRLVAQEGLSDCSVAVEFVAYDRRLDHGSENQASTAVRVVQPPSEFRPFEGMITKPYRQVRVCFRGETWARICPAVSDSQVIDESKFDWSDVPGMWEPGEDIYEYLERDRRRWHQSGVCPNPRIYQVEGSRWLYEASVSGEANPRLKQYIILGHDSFVEVLAEDHVVIEGQMLDAW